MKNTIVKSWLAQNNMMPDYTPRGRPQRGFTISTHAVARGSVFRLQLTDQEILATLPGKRMMLYVGTYSNRKLAENAGIQIIRSKNDVISALTANPTIDALHGLLASWGVAPTNSRDRSGKGYNVHKNKTGRFILTIRDKSVLAALGSGKDSMYVATYKTQKEAEAVGIAMIKDKQKLIDAFAGKTLA